MVFKSYYLSLIVSVLALGGLGWLLIFDRQESGASVIVLDSSVTAEVEEKVNVELDKRFSQLNRQLLAIQSQYDQLTGEVAELSGVVDALEGQVEIANALSENRVKENNSISDATTGKAVMEDANIFQVSIEVEQKSTESISSQLNTFMNDENVDSAWSVMAENQISNVLASDVLIESDLVIVECRSTMCRIEVQHADEQIAGNFVPSFNSTLGWEFDSFVQVVNEPEGEFRTIIHISRDKHVLPNF